MQIYRLSHSALQIQSSSPTSTSPQYPKATHITAHPIAMAETHDDSTPGMTTKATAASSPPPTPLSAFQPTWQLPQGIERHIEAFVLKSAVGVTAGAAAGLLLFRSGRGANAAAGAAFGMGCAAGSFVERVIAEGDVDPAVPRFEVPAILSGWNKKE